MKVMIVLALLGIFAASNGGNDTTVEAPSYDSVVYADYFEENPEAAANYYPEAYATYLEEKDAVEAMNELYAQSEQNTCDTYYYESTGVDENAWSDTNETAPMPENEFSNEDILGYWVDYSDAEQPRIMYFYEENGQLMHRYYTIVAGNENGMNIANEVTEWEYSKGVVNTMPNQGSISCMCGTSDRVYISFYYGFDGADEMVCQENGTVFYRVQ